jgi:diketogulonate reductase-like aldo/keto reductase
MVSQTHITLNRTGDNMPLAGFGTARISNDDTAEVVYNAIKTGYRLIDGALLYGNEAQVGEGVRRAIDEGIVKREELFSKFCFLCTHQVAHPTDCIFFSYRKALEPLPWKGSC